MGWNTVELMVIYILWPETKARMLESLDEVFLEPNPVKKGLGPKILRVLLDALVWNEIWCA